MHFLVVEIYGGFWEIMSSYKYLIDGIGGDGVRKGSENWSKLTNIMTFLHFSFIFIPPKLDMNTFSGSISLWRLLVDSEPLHVLL